MGSGSQGVTSPSGTTPISNTNPLYNYYASPLSAGYGPNATLAPTNAATTNVSSTPSTIGDWQGHFWGNGLQSYYRHHHGEQRHQGDHRRDRGNDQ